MKPADLLYSVPGRARRGNTERTTKESGPPGQESSGLEAQGSSSFVHGFGRGGTECIVTSAPPRAVPRPHPCMGWRAALQPGRGTREACIPSFSQHAQRACPKPTKETR